MRLLLALLLIMVSGCSKGAGGRVEVKPDDHSPFTLVPSEPFRLEFGRGSGWEGLDTVKITEDGSVQLHRFVRTFKGNVIDVSVESARLQLTDRQVEELRTFINDEEITSMHRMYSRSDIADGTQWALWITQGDQEKSIYFNNSFPGKIQRFAQFLDGMLRDTEIQLATWKPVPTGKIRDHEKALWNSIK